MTKEYDAFGNENSDNTDDSNSFGYNGEYLDRETGLIYLRARYYDPSIGRFISEDPIKDGSNWYAFCNNNPVTFIDPSGMEYLVVSGSEYDDGRWKYNFIEPAIKKVKDLKGLNDNEWITWIVSEQGYSEEALKLMNDTAYELGVGFVRIKSAAELQNYINSQDKYQWELSHKRLEDPIRKFTVFSHGLVGKVSLGYNQKNVKELELDYYWTRGISSEAFDNPNSAFYSCNTGTDKYGWGSSFAQMWANKAGGRTWAARGKTDYLEIMNYIFSNKWSRNEFFSVKGSDNYPKESKGVEWMNFYRN